MSFSIPKFLKLSVSGHFDDMYCTNCSDNTKFTRIFGATSSKITKDRETLMMEIKEDYIYRYIDKNIQLGLDTRRKSKTKTSDESKVDGNTDTTTDNDGPMYSRFLNSDDDDDANDIDASVFGGYKKGEL